MNSAVVKHWVFSLLIILVAGIFPQANAQTYQSDDVLKIVEYGDYQCPACRSYHAFLEQLKRDFEGKLVVEYKHFPIQTHAYAGLAARAAEAARNQGKFTEMHNMLFKYQDEWTGSDARLIIKGYAKDLNLDIEKFTEDWHSIEVYNRVRDDKDRGIELKVRETPTLFIEGEAIPLPMNYQQMKNYLAREFKKRNI